MFTEIIANFSLVTAFLFFFNQIFKNQRLGLKSSMRTKAIVGIMHGLFSIVLMFFSVQVTPTTMLDFRQLMIISSANFGGIYSSVLTSLIVVAGRIVLFGGINHSSVAASISALTLGIGSGLLAKFVSSYWRRWILSLGLSSLLVSSTLYYLLSAKSLELIPYIVALIIVGGLFTATLIAYFCSSDRLQFELQKSEVRYRRLHSHQEAIFHSAYGVSIIATDTDGNITLFNKGAEIMLGYRAEDVIGKSDFAIFHLEAEVTERGEELSHKFERPIKGFNIFAANAKSGRIDEREWTYVRKDGTHLQVNLIVTPIIADREIIGFMGVATDITERKKAEETLRRANEMLQELSLRDGLTGISNRRHFDESLEREWHRARRDSTSLSLILFDIDYFKKYNDRYGHQAGDECLRTVARMLKSMIQRKTDIYARYGGEEFVVILPNTDVVGATGIAELIRLAIEACAIPHAASLVSEFVTISAGVASISPDTESDFNALIAEADALLYEAKQSGRNRVISSSSQSNNQN